MIILNMVHFGGFLGILRTIYGVRSNYVAYLKSGEASLYFLILPELNPEPLASHALAGVLHYSINAYPFEFCRIHFCELEKTQTRSRRRRYFGSAVS